MLMGVTILLLVNISKVPAARSWFPGELPPVHTFPDEVQCWPGTRCPRAQRGAGPATLRPPAGPASAYEVEALLRGGEAHMGIPPFERSPKWHVHLPG